MADNEYTVYMHTTPSGKRYIGITKQSVERRWRQGFGYRDNEHFFRAILKYGWDNIKHEILFEGETEESAMDLEAEYIVRYHTKDNRHGYNHTDGGKGISGCYLSKASRLKMSSAHTGEKHYFYGKHQSEASKQKISKFRVELCKKPGIANMMREVNPNKKIVYQYSLDGNLIKTWESRHQAENYFVEGKKSLAIGKCCQGDCNGAYGYIWSYIPLTIMPPVARLRKVYQYSTEGIFIKEWDNLQEAINGYRSNQISSVIGQCVTGHRPTAYGYAWSYKPPLKAGEQVG